MRKYPEFNLWTLCEKFIKDNEISCPESIYQCDHVIENAHEFIEEICKEVGYFIYEEEEEDRKQVSIDSDMGEIEHWHIKRVLIACKGNKARASRILNISVKTLYRKIKKYGINTDRIQ